MELVDRIEKIDPKFVAALRSGNVRETIAASPWAWMEHELSRIPDADKSDFGPQKIRVEDALRLLFEFSSRKIGHVVTNLVKKSKLKIIVKGFLVYRNANEVKIRLFLEYNAEGHRPTWFKALIYLCEQNRECTMREISEALGVKLIASHILEDAPRIFWNSSREVLTDLKTNPKRIIKPEFYNQIYLKMKPWLTPEGYKVFEEWKQKYNQ